MPASLAFLPHALLSATSDWFAHGVGDAPARAGGNALISPRDPPSLTLALVGAATVGIYLAARWRPPRRDAENQAARFSNPSARSELPRSETTASDENRQSRGAA